MWLRNFLAANRELFPTTWSFLIFITYMALFVSQGLLVTASRLGGDRYPYNPTTVVLVTELLKLIIASFTFICQNSVISLFRNVLKHWRVAAYYLVPAGLYCLYNNLAFSNLSIFDPTTYFIFMQIRLLMTGVIYQFLFQRRLSGKQWLSLLILTVGCMLQGLDVSGTEIKKKEDLEVVIVDQSNLGSWFVLQMSTGIFLILIQVCCSVFAGVYNEYIIKKIGSDVDIMVQNVYMYLDSIFCNLAVLMVQGKMGHGDVLDLFTLKSLEVLLQVFVIGIIINNSLVGIVTSLFLKNLNSILKAFASALELIFTAILSFILLGIPIYWNTLLAVCIVSYSVVMYAQNPVKSTGFPEMNPKIRISQSKNVTVEKREVKFKKLVKFENDVVDNEKDNSIV